MALYNKETKLSDAVMTHPELISVINRLGINLGVGDNSVGSICSREHIDSDFFIAVVNTFLNKDYFPVDGRGTFKLDKTIDYLGKTSLFYRHLQLPNIERHFRSLIEKSGSDNNLLLLRRFFEEMRDQLNECLEYDDTVLFPSLLSGEVPDGFVNMDARNYEVEEKIHDLLFFFVVHLTGSYDRNLCTAVVQAVFSLYKDYMQNNRIRTRIFLPLVEEMKKSYRDD